MAVTKLLRIKETSGKSKARHLKNNINYICKPEKTDLGKWIGGNAGDTPEQIFNTIKRNKQLWNKESGSQAFHYVLSFPPEANVPEKLALQIAQDFCEELLGEDYYFVIAVHNDKEHMHAHITFDSVNRNTGRKFHSPKGDWEKRIQPITDQLCVKYKLPTLQYVPQERAGKYYKQWEEEKKNPVEDGSNQNKYSWYDIIQDDINEAIAKADTWDGFLAYLKEQHYEIKVGKYLSLRPYGKERAVRTYQLGAGYGKDEILERIINKKGEKAAPVKTYGDRLFITKIFVAKKIENKKWKLSLFQKQFYRKWHFTYFIRQPDWHSVAWKYKKDILRVEKLASQLSYIIDHDINKIEDIEVRLAELLKNKKEIRNLKNRRIHAWSKREVLVCAEKYLAIKNELENFPNGTRKDLEIKLVQLQNEIEESSTLCEVLSLYEAAKDEIHDYDLQLVEIKDEISILQRLAETKLEVPQFNSYVPAADSLYGKFTRVTINEKLFSSRNEETNTTRIPFLKRYVTFENKDCKMLNEDKTMSVYIYDEKEYLVTDADGKEKKILGQELKGYYDNKNRKKQDLIEKVGIGGNRRES